MSILRRQMAVMILFLCISASAASLEARDDLTEAENVAKSYMTALFEGDVETAANLTLKETLVDLKRRYLKDLDKAKTDRREREFLEGTGVEVDARKLRAMSPHELYVVVMEGGRRKAGERSQGMKRAQVKVESSKRVGKNEVAVHLKAVIPTEKGPVTKEGGLLLSREGSAWRVKSNLEKSGR